MSLILLAAVTTTATAGAQRTTARGMRVRRPGAGNPREGGQWQGCRDPLAPTPVVHHNIIAVVTDDSDGLRDPHLGLPLR